MPQKEPMGIGGWLLAYIVWAAFGIIFSLYSNGHDLLVYREKLPILLPAAILVFVLVLIFYGIYALWLVMLIRQRSGIIRKIRLIILLTPVFNGILPAIFVFAASMNVPLGNLWHALSSAYSVPITASIAGAFVMALVWYRYFSVSRRVRNTWPEG